MLKQQYFNTAKSMEMNTSKSLEKGNGLSSWIPQNEADIADHTFS